MDQPVPDPDGLRELRSELRAAETSFRQMAENVPGALFRYLLRPDGSDAVLYMSPRCVELWEVEAERIREDATLLWQMIDPEDLPGMQASVMASARTLGPWHWEWRITTPSGRRKWLQGNGRPERADDGTIVWNSLILDVTARREADEALRRSERRLQQLMAITGEGLWDWDLDSGNVVHNARWCELLGLPTDDQQHALAGFVERLHEDDRDAVLARVQACLRGEGPYRSQHRMRRGDGTVIWVEDRGDVIERHADGRARRMLGSLTDIGDRRAAAEARAAKEAAELANRAKSAFLARMSHELRTPLNAVLGFAQLLALDPVLRQSPTAPQQLRHVRNAGEHLLAMIDEVLDLARIEAGGLRLSLEAVDPVALVEDGFALLRPLAERRQVALRLHAGAEPAWVRADRTRLRQVLVNLVGNAVKYNRTGGRVEVALDAAAGGVRLAVRDTGPGLSAEQLAGLFQPFNRLGAETGPVEGSGLGLVISKQLAEAMGGRIEVHSVPGEGSVFTLWLPAAAAPASAAPATRPAELDADTGAEPMRVLYVEDNPVNVELVREALARMPGVTLAIETDGLQGLAAARRDLPDLLLVDLDLPGLHGLELLRGLREDARTASIPCIAVSANALDTDIAQARAAGFADVLTKPFRLDKLFEAVTLRRPRRAA